MFELELDAYKLEASKVEVYRLEAYGLEVKPGLEVAVVAVVAGLVALEAAPCIVVVIRTHSLFGKNFIISLFILSSSHCPKALSLVFCCISSIAASCTT